MYWHVIDWMQLHVTREHVMLGRANLNRENRGQESTMVDGFHQLFGFQ